MSFCKPDDWDSCRVEKMRLLPVVILIMIKIDLKPI